MMFETDHDMTADGMLGPAVWKALIDANVHGQKSSFGYSFAMVHEADSGEYTTCGTTARRSSRPRPTPAAGAGGTPLGTYPVFEHLPSTTMSGTNTDGSTYVDPGILWVSYFNGGDALHYYDRASYGSPQSNGCVEMPEAAAADDLAVHAGWRVGRRQHLSDRTALTRPRHHRGGARRIPVQAGVRRCAANSRAVTAIAAEPLTPAWQATLDQFDADLLPTGGRRQDTDRVCQRLHPVRPLGIRRRSPA